MHDHTTHDPSVKLCECGCGQPAPIAKSTDRKRGHVKGQPIRFINHHEKRRPIAERLWGKIDRRGPNDCWNWTGTKNTDGYGRIRISDRMLSAHRIAYELHYGLMDETLQVLHRCDNPSCCNPRHLFLGSQRDNVADAISKGRFAKAIGQAHHSARFTSEQVRYIRGLYATGRYTQRELARQYDMSKAAMRRIVLGLSYQDA